MLCRWFDGAIKCGFMSTGTIQHRQDISIQVIKLIYYVGVISWLYNKMTKEQTITTKTSRLWVSFHN